MDILFLQLILKESHPQAGSPCLGTTVTLEPHRSHTFSLDSAPSPLDAELCPERTACALSWSQSILTISGTSESPAPPGPRCWCWCCGNTGILPSPNAVPHTPWHSRLSVTVATRGSSLFPSWPPADCYRAKLSLLIPTMHPTSALQAQSSAQCLVGP